MTEAELGGDAGEGHLKSSCWPTTPLTVLQLVILKPLSMSRSTGAILVAETRGRATVCYSPRSCNQMYAYSIKLFLSPILCNSMYSVHLHL